MTKATSPIPVPRATLAMGAAGAIVGGAVSAARNMGKVKNESISREDAVKDVLREAGTTGLSTATATAVAGALRLGGLLGLVGFVGVAIGTKYLADKALDKRAAQKAPVRVKDKAPAKAKAAGSKKTAGSKKVVKTPSGKTSTAAEKKAAEIKK